MPSEDKKGVNTKTRKDGNGMKMKVSEWVSLGHPDKIADYISEYILDRYIEQDPFTRYALEVQIKDFFVTLGGEISSKADISDEDIARFVREAVAEIGYTPEYQEKWGLENTISSEDLETTIHISRQSDDIAVGVDGGGWGDQGIMFGMAENSPETCFMPKDIYLARRIGKQLFDDQIGGLDIKTQVYMHEDAVVKIIIAIPQIIKNWAKAGLMPEINVGINKSSDNIRGFAWNVNYIGYGGWKGVPVYREGVPVL